MEKYDIVNGLAREFGLRRYLEICTSTTGLKFQYVDPAHFDAYHRLMYRCPPGHDDGFEITHRTEAETSHALVAELHATLPAAERYDIILVDPHHTYRASRLDLLGALCLLAPHGIMVVHDCNPTDPSIVQPQFQHGSWCGVTYQAYVDFLLGGRLAGHCTVDADYGCGVVFNEAASVPAPWRGRHPPPRLALDWAEAADDDSRRYDLFDRHRAALLNLVTPEHFRAVPPRPPPPAATPSPTIPAPNSWPATRPSPPSRPRATPSASACLKAPSACASSRAPSRPPRSTAAATRVPSASACTASSCTTPSGQYFHRTAVAEPEI